MTPERGANSLGLRRGLAHVLSAAIVAMGLGAGCSAAAPASRPHSNGPTPSAGAASSSVAIPPQAAAREPISIPFAIGGNLQGVAVDDEGALVAFYGPDVLVVRADTGSPVAAFRGECVTNAQFVPKARKLLVRRCPGTPLPAHAGPDASDVDIEIWDLDTSAKRPIARGPYSALEFTRDDASVVLVGRERASVRRLDDGRETASFPAAPWPNFTVSSDGTRALVTEGDETRLERPGKPPIVLAREVVEALRKGAASPDLQHVASLDDAGNLVVRRIEDGVVLRTVKHAPASEVVAIAPSGDAMAILRKAPGVRGGTVLDIADPKGVRCTFTPDKDRFDERISGDSRARWSADSTRLLLDTRLTHLYLRGSDCTLEHATKSLLRVHPAAPPSLASVVEESEGELQIVGSTARGALPIRTERSLSVAGFQSKRLRLANGDFAGMPLGLESGPSYEEFGLDLATLTLSSAEKPRPRLGGKTIAVRMEDGSVLPIEEAIQSPDIGKAILLRAPEHSSLTLPGSEAFAEESDDRRGCFTAANGSYLACSHRLPDFVSSELVVWDAAGKKLLRRSGSVVEFSPSGDRMVVVDAASPGADPIALLLDTRSGRVLKKGPLAEGRFSFDPTGAFLAWPKTGMVDAKTGATLWKGEDLTPLFGNPARVGLVREDLREPAYMRAPDDPTPPFGPFDVVEARSKKLVRSLSEDVEIVGGSDDGSVIVTRDLAGVRRVRDAVTLDERFRTQSLGTPEAAQGGNLVISSDGRFAFTPGLFSIVAWRLEDRARLDLFLPKTPGSRGAALSSSGFFEGDPAWDEQMVTLFAAESAGRGASAPPARRREGLVADFFAGKPIP